MYLVFLKQHGSRESFPDEDMQWCRIVWVKHAPGRGAQSAIQTNRRLSSHIQSTRTGRNKIQNELFWTTLFSLRAYIDLWHATLKKKKVWAQDLRLFSVLMTVLTYFSTTVASGMEALGTTEVEEGSSEVERWRLRLLELRRKESLSLLEPERVSTGSSGGGLIFTLAWRERPEPNLEE